MKFLIIFLVVITRWYWPRLQLNTYSRVFSNWLKPWQKNRLLAKLPEPVKYFFIVVLPALAIGLGLFYSKDLAFGTVNFLLEWILVFYVLLHLDVKKHMDIYREKIQQDDLVGAAYYARQSLSIKEEQGDQGVNELVVKAVLYRWFKYFFFIVFWYLILGGAGVVLAWFSVQYANLIKARKPRLYLYFLEYIPVRLLALTFGLAGNLAQVWVYWKNCLKDIKIRHGDLLFCTATLALSADEKPTKNDPQKALQELDGWESLYTRSVSIWLVVIALATLFDF